MRWIALLRGINVGGKNKLPMADLRDIFEEAGAEGVATYIQSGNVLFEATAARAKRIPVAVQKVLAAERGIDSPVLVRSADELVELAKEHPFQARSLDPKLLHVALLEKSPSKTAAAKLDPDRSPPDAYELVGRELYLVTPNGFRKTRFTLDYLERTLGTTCTIRNWNTLQKLVELTTA